MNLRWEKLSSCFVWVCGWVVCMAELKPAPTRHPDPGKMEWAGDRRLYSWQYLSILGNIWWYLAILGDTWGQKTLLLTIFDNSRQYLGTGASTLWNTWWYYQVFGYPCGYKTLLLATLCNTWQYLVTFGSTWWCLVVLGGTWWCLTIVGDDWHTWQYLTILSDNWRYLKALLGNIYRHKPLLLTTLNIIWQYMAIQRNTWLCNCMVTLWDRSPYSS